MALHTEAPQIRILRIEAKLMYTHEDKKFRTHLYGFEPGSRIDLPEDCTHFGFVASGEIHIDSSLRAKPAVCTKGDFFSIPGAARIHSDGTGIVTSAYKFVGIPLFGGPIEKEGRLKYIDGCTDTLWIPPLRKGDPCLNHLHFPANIRQTGHTHPSVRIGAVYRGSGCCLSYRKEGKRLVRTNEILPLAPGSAFVIETNAGHSFETQGESMDVIAFHPDSNFGPTDKNHPMINRTMIGRKSAKHIRRIQTR